MLALLLIVSSAAALRAGLSLAWLCSTLPHSNRDFELV
jgi:hypothetical protein